MMSDFILLTRHHNLKLVANINSAISCSSAEFCILMFLYRNLKIGSLVFWHDLHEVKLYRSYNFIFLFISKDKLKKPERPTIKSGLKLRVEKSVDFRPIQYSVIYDFHASKVNTLSTRAHQDIYGRPIPFFAPCRHHRRNLIFELRTAYFSMEDLA